MTVHIDNIPIWSEFPYPDLLPVGMKVRRGQYDIGDVVVYDHPGSGKAVDMSYDSRDFEMSRDDFKERILAPVLNFMGLDKAG